MDVVILMGLPASGKTSFHQVRFAATHAHVSKDCFRNARRPEQRQRTLIREALAAGRSVVVDNTNPTRADRAVLIAMAREAGARVVGYFFESKAAACRDRNARREGRARVPVVAIHAAAKRLQLPSPAEGFDELLFVRLNDGGGFEVSPWTVVFSRDPARDGGDA
jgi:predicted kinase